MHKKKVLLVAASPLYECPYISTYIEILNREKIEYDLIYWNRHGEDTHSDPPNFYSYNKYTEITYPFWRKIIKISGYANYVRKHLQKHKYSIVVVYTIAHAIFMKHFLTRKYKNRYIFDIRDFSPMCNIPFFKRSTAKLVGYSACTVVSSEGFLNWLPKLESKYLICHNISLSTIQNNIDIDIQKPNANITRILTIGLLRDDVANCKIMNAFANRDKFKLTFTGYGWALPILKQNAKNNDIKNVTFTGRYKKEDELSIISQFDLVNIFLGHNINSDTLMSNRFYNSVICGKPIMVNSGCYQAELCEKYHLGVVLNNEDDMLLTVSDYIEHFNTTLFKLGRDSFLRKVVKEMEDFECSILRLIQSF